MKKNLNLTSATIILIGGILGVLGVFLAAQQAIKDKAELDEKNKKIIGLTEENSRLSKQALDLITGGNSWAFIKCGLETSQGIIDQQAIWNINLVGNIPLYDVSLSIFEVIHDHSLPTEAYDLVPILSKEVGTVTPSLHPDNIGLITLSKNKDKIEFLAKIKARNGEITQHIILMKKKDGYWSLAQKIFRYIPGNNWGFKKEILDERINEDFPERNIEWIEL